MCAEMNSFHVAHVSHSLVRDVMAEIGEGAGDPVVAPSAVVLGHADDQLFNLRADSRSS